MQLSDFDYALPPDRIAQAPLPERDAARLLVLGRHNGTISHHRFYELPEILRPDDVVVINDSKVIPARLQGRKRSGGRVEVLLVRPLERDTWLAMTRPALAPGTAVEVAKDGHHATIAVLSEQEDGLRTVQLRDLTSPVEDAIAGLGELPTPPYVHEPVRDPSRYQTVYAAAPGSVAAPTAGLHFTPRVLAALASRGITVERLTLHVGPGTFLPVRSATIEHHRMHEEEYTVPPATARRINAARKDGRRIVAVGTTTCRVLESAGQEGDLQTGSGTTSLFITPGFTFRMVDALLTNFHLPRSTLLMLVSAFAGRERILDAYATAVREGYRFYSFGDAMLIA